MVADNQKAISQSEETIRETDKKQVWWLPSIYIFSKATAWIAIPIIVALYVGDWLDTKYQSGNKWLLIIVGLAFILSMIGLIKTTIEEWKKLNQPKLKLNKKDK